MKRINVPIKGDGDGRVRGVFGEDDRLANHGLGNETLNRVNAIDTAKKYFLNGNARVDTPSRRGCAATWGASGTGKTHLIDELVAWMATEDRFVPIVANFNDAHTGYVFGVDGLLVRMLFAHFVGLAVPLVDGKPGFAIAARALHALVQENKVYYSQVIDTILCDVDDTRGVAVDRRIAAVFVDEIRKATANETDMEPCLRVYRDVVDALVDPNVRLLLTALDLVSAFGIMDDRRSESTSRCPITWLSLPPVDVVVNNGDRLLERCVAQLALAHGHPRTIVSVLHVRRNHEADDAQSLFEHLETEIAGTARVPATPFLAPALMSIWLRMDVKFDGSELSFGATVRGGALLNSCVRDGMDADLDEAVPLLDLFSLRQMSRKNTGGVLRDSLVKLCDLLLKVVGGQEYEELHTHWETAVRCLFHKHRITLKCSDSMPLLSDSPANDDFPLALYRGVTFLTSSARSVIVRTAACKPVLCLKERLSVTLTEWHDESGKEVKRIELGQTVVAGERNAGFDLATLYEEADKKERKHLLLIECKHSPADTGIVQGWVNAAVADDNDADGGDIPARAGDNDDDLVHDLHGKEKMQGERKTKKGKVRVRKGERNAKPAAVAAKKGPDGLSTKMEIMSETVNRVLKSDQHLFVRSGISEASQITCLFVLLRPITDTFIDEATEWIEKREIKFNVAVIARDELLALYGPSLRAAVALVLEAEDE